VISIIDYGLGNVKAIANVYKKLDVPISIARQPDDLRRTGKVILPGVGAFDEAIRRLDGSGMREILDEFVLHRRLPVLGICVGMQMLAHSSEEGKLAGLGWVDADVRRFDPASMSLAPPVCIPHMGWNTIRVVREGGLLKELNNGARFYFLHSYYMRCRKSEDVIAMADYGGEFACAVNTANVYGVQFHPEKSHQFGIQLLKNFAEL